MLEVGCDVKLPVAFPVGTIISIGLTLCADFLERLSLLYLKLACILLTDALAAVLLIGLCNMMDVRLLPPKRAQSVSQVWLAVGGSEGFSESLSKACSGAGEWALPSGPGQEWPGAAINAVPHIKVFKSPWSHKRRIKDHRKDLKLPLKYSIVYRLYCLRLKAGKNRIPLCVSRIPGCLWGNVESESVAGADSWPGCLQCVQFMHLHLCPGAAAQAHPIAPVWHGLAEPSLPTQKCEEGFLMYCW